MSDGSMPLSGNSKFETGAIAPGTFSIVVPTYNRMDILPEVLNAILELDGIQGQELIVVNDGSDESTREFLDRWQEEAVSSQPPLRAGFRDSNPEQGLKSLRVEILHQENQGPAAARNQGVSAASGLLVAFLGDDTVPTKGWLTQHLSAHARGAASGIEPDLLGVIGYTGWHRRMRLNPFLRYINDYGLQFGYALINDPLDVPYNFFYTSNLSLPRQLLVEEPFDVEFPYAAWEDIEVSYRLKERGFRLNYAEEAVVAHDHPTTIERFGDRQEKAGYCAVVFYLKHPELGGFLGVGEDGPPPLPAEDRFRREWRLVRTLQAIVSTKAWSLLPFGWARIAPKWLTKLWVEVLRYHYIKGLRRCWRDRVVNDQPDSSA